METIYKYIQYGEERGHTEDIMMKSPQKVCVCVCVRVHTVNLFMHITGRVITVSKPIRV